MDYEESVEGEEDLTPRKLSAVAHVTIERRSFLPALLSNMRTNKMDNSSSFTLERYTVHNGRSL